MTAPLTSLVERYTGRKLAGTAPLSGGSVGHVTLITLENGGRVVAKQGAGLEPEGWMLRFLASHTMLPVPHVIHADSQLLLMDYVEAGGAVTPAAETHAAELLAALHGHTWHSFGAERDTVIGGLVQPNTPTRRWVDFFRDHRLLYMAEEAHKAGRLPAELMARVEVLAGRLNQWIDEPDHPRLIHGDCWGGNVLVKDGRIAAFIDPALYYGHPEMELAFATLFGTFGDAFFARYGELRPLEPGFWEARRDLYNLYPLLVHVRLFGGSYVDGVERIVHRFLE
ncbi:MAG: fructosamine kinase family protein [Rhodospirillaceae bacterium]|nr:fructosamine kinase family protein [Rhodospirillales bacterium]